ncbi:LacI family DNA-binding transcriptional regulator [uncultured Cohaesibacter sp.]|uniref:LacI family DNA-binding transcriptional regulator n=1 Tax=uncultured Cohaesibacter sp. TaxID=1002546 RepID=UPI00292EDA95|nr:LacI family DNA-binding transcriptional regulator [uncultured Cohaesibacter sp.]
MATLADIAQEVGVSNKTVSLTLRGKKCSSDETAKRIFEAAEKYGYLKKYAARTFNGRQVSCIGFLADKVATSPYSVELVRGAQAEAIANDRVLIIGSLENYENGNQQDLWRMFRTYNTAGVIYASRYRKIVEQSDANDIERVVYMNCTPAGDKNGVILPDDEEGGFLQASHLLDHGHKRIAVISLPNEDPATALRLKGISKALAERNVQLDPEMCRLGVSGYLPVGETYIAFETAVELLKRPVRPTAIICGNDRIAMMVYNAAVHLGLRIPQDLSVIGFDDFVTVSENVRPKLTTVRLPYFEMGRSAVSAIINGVPAGERVNLIACELIERRVLRPTQLLSAGRQITAHKTTGQKRGRDQTILPCFHLAIDLFDRSAAIALSLLWGLAKSSSGPIGTMPVGLIMSWLA